MRESLFIASSDGIEAMPSSWGHHEWLDVITGAFDGDPAEAVRVNVGAVHSKEDEYDYHLYREKMDEIHDLVWHYPKVESLFLGSTPYVVCMLSVKHAPLIQPWLDACPNLKRLGILGRIQSSDLKEGLIGLELTELWAVSLDAQNTLDMLETLCAPLERLTIAPRNNYSYTNAVDPEWAAEVVSSHKGLKHLGLINADTYGFDQASDRELVFVIGANLKLPNLETLDLSLGDWENVGFSEFLEVLNPENLPALLEIQVGGMWVTNPKIPAKWAHLQIECEPENQEKRFRYATCNE